ncbi:hypothetical protein TSACC_21690 [Terrimicrobium sacchariphilum]|uniref:Uncharacterized protein n=1 Tax=Terrimicrobium sacchariphilum TaxID=690879 RepID=A0A146G8U3_TERSA|nr:hypothetical protein [Terrimicrobium sacchariphilum]GAT33277.1 hypothetical protein TSACC_21690 [Terrimicrobium sacchariphilum]
MKETSYAFPAPIADAMIRALLEGRKSQIRVPVNNRKWMQVYDGIDYANGADFMGPGIYHPTVIKRGIEQPGPEMFGIYSSDGEWGIPSPLGAPGDRVRFREAWGKTYEPIHWDGGCATNDGTVRYRADYVPVGAIIGPKPEKWRSSHTMPRHLSRISREIVSVRVERVQEISNKDAKAEGAVLSERIKNLQCWHASYRAGFASLWNRAYLPESWCENPLVWVYEVK